MKAITPNATDQSIYFTVIDTTGVLAAVATLNAAISSITLKYKTAPTAAESSTALTALAAATTAHTDNYAYAVGVGVVRVDFPDAPWAAGSGSVLAWLTFGGGLSGYAVAGGMKTIPLGYGLQQADSGSGELARADDLATVDSNVDAILVDTGTTIPATLATIDSNVDAVLVDTDTTIPGLIATVDANVDAILVDTGDTLPTAISAIGSVGAGLTATNLDPRYIFTFEGDNSVATASNIIGPINAGSTVTIGFSIRGVANRDATISGTPTITESSDDLTPGDVTVHQSRDYAIVSVAIDSEATTGSNTITATITTTDSCVFVLTGVLKAQAVA